MYVQFSGHLSTKQQHLQSLSKSWQYNSKFILSANKLDMQKKILHF